MEKIINCIDEYTKDLEKRIMEIVEDQTISLTNKNQLMEPIADQKKVLVYAKEALLKIKDKKYEAKCGMSKLRSDNGA
jgi:predicted house-cleaning noncanonical NTP pyrophosphatase (MazG superfamily)